MGPPAVGPQPPQLRVFSFATGERVCICMNILNEENEREMKGEQKKEFIQNKIIQEIRNSSFLTQFSFSLCREWYVKTYFRLK